MTKRKIIIANFDKIRKAQTLSDVRANITEDRFFQFQVMYGLFTGNEPEFSSEARGTIDCLVRAVAILNKILSLAEGDQEADKRRCAALLQILQDNLDIQTSTHSLTPLQRILIDITKRIRSQIMGFGGEKKKQLILIP